MLHHAATRADWDARSETHYEPAGLAAEGFVHCSTAEQLRATLGRYYVGRSDLVLLTLDAAALTADLVWEDTSGRGELFPHVYGPIPLGAVITAEDLAVDADGVMRRA
ncbi:MAG: DUF952 domain-containing protein [Actinomycetota bacterium]